MTRAVSEQILIVACLCTICLGCPVNFVGDPITSDLSGVCQCGNTTASAVNGLRCKQNSKSSDR
jgi:hypothetical protein